MAKLARRDRHRRARRLHRERRRHGRRAGRAMARSASCRSHAPLITTLAPRRAAGQEGRRRAVDRRLRRLHGGDAGQGDRPGRHRRAGRGDRPRPRRRRPHAAPRSDISPSAASEVDLAAGRSSRCAARAVRLQRRPAPAQPPRSGRWATASGIERAVASVRASRAVTPHRSSGRWRHAPCDRRRRLSSQAPER